MGRCELHDEHKALLAMAALVCGAQVVAPCQATFPRPLVLSRASPEQQDQSSAPANSNSAEKPQNLTTW